MARLARGPVPDWAAEAACWEQGLVHIAGCDEAGRGPLAGPVVAAAVVLPPRLDLPGLHDSKQLTAPRRDALYDLIQAQALAVGVAAAEPAEIDARNILAASLAAMARAVAALDPPADLVLVDGNQRVPGLACPQQTLVKGDARSMSIAAASIIAKVTRDRQLIALDEVYPGYGFARHKGYPSPAHLEALARLGPCPAHRRSFAPIRDWQPTLWDAAPDPADGP